MCVSDSHFGNFWHKLLRKFSFRWIHLDEQWIWHCYFTNTNISLEHIHVYLCWGGVEQHANTFRGGPSNVPNNKITQKTIAHCHTCVFLFIRWNEQERKRLSLMMFTMYRTLMTLGETMIPIDNKQFLYLSLENPASHIDIDNTKCVPKMTKFADTTCVKPLLCPSLASLHFGSYALRSFRSLCAHLFLTVLNLVLYNLRAHRHTHTNITKENYNNRR